MWRGIGSFLLLLVAACSNMAPTEIVESSEDAPCTAERAEAADIRELIRAAPQRTGDCVSVRGLVNGWALFADVNALYQPPTDLWKDSSNGGTLGLQWGGEDRTLPDTGEAELIGTLQDCAWAHAQIDARREANPDLIIMSSGYCHTSEGLYLMVEHARALGPVRWERQMPSRARRGYGDLEPVREDWPLRRRVEAVARDFVDAVRAGDRERLIRLHGDFEDADEGEEKATLDFLLTEAASPFASLRGAARAPQMQVFYLRLTPAETAAAGDNIGTRWPVACFCLKRDCARMWPIDDIDADNLPSRPYACVAMDEVGVGSRKIRLSTPRAPIGLIEPPGSAM